MGVVSVDKSGGVRPGPGAASRAGGIRLVSATTLTMLWHASACGCSHGHLQDQGAWRCGWKICRHAHRHGHQLFDREEAVVAEASS
jgi:hypothetical protein